MANVSVSGVYTQPRKYYFFWMIAWYALMTWIYIGVESARSTILFYVALSVVPFIMIFADILFKNVLKKQIGFIDCITIEKPRIPILTPRVNLILAVFLAIVITLSILRTNTAFVDYPSYGFFDSNLGNSFFSAVVILPENWFFFDFLFPTIYINLLKKKNSLVAFLLAIGSVMFLFMLEHYWVYHSSPTALFSTVIFAFMMCSINFATGFALIADFAHIANNFVASLIRAAVYIVFRQ